MAWQVLGTQVIANIEGKIYTGLHDILNYYGRHGWELVSICWQTEKPTAIFKRPLSVPPVQAPPVAG